jgi:BASS family bile acid:Na+ symporter
MDLLDAALRLCVVVFVVSSLAEAGLGVAPRAVLAPLRHARFVVLTLIVGWLVCPAIAYLLIQALPLAAPYATGLMLLALAPGAPFAPALARLTRADSAYMTAFMVLTAAVTVVLMPVGVPLLIPGSAAAAGVIARPLLLLVLLPLLAGVTVRGLRPGVADRMRPLLAGMTRAVALGLLALLVAVHGGSVLEAVGSYAILAMLVFVGGVTLVAYLLGADLADEQRNVLTIGMCTRNLGAALAPAAAIDPDRRVIVMIVIAIPIMLVVAAVTIRMLARVQSPIRGSGAARAECRNRIAGPNAPVRPSGDAPHAPAAKG